MQKVTSVLLAALFLIVAAARADEKEDKKAARTAKIAEQKKAAEANWETVEAGPSVIQETANLLVIAPKSMEKRIKDVGALLEKAHDQAKKALAFEATEEPYPGKITVYLFPGPDQFRAFVRRVEKRRLEGEEVGSHSATDELVHAAASPGKTPAELSVEAQGAAQVASVLLVRRAGVKTPVADWLVEGFGRATWYRVAPRDRTTVQDRQQAARQAVRRSAKDIYTGVVERLEAPALRGSLAEYLAYGPAAAKFSALLKGFEPEENVESKSTEQALEAAGLAWDRVDRGWKGWAPLAR